jgi:hypothetical protein
MASENEIIIAFLFKRSGKEKMSFSELYLNLSMELGWFSPEDAKKFLYEAIKNKLLTNEDEQISLTFDVNKIKIPVGFSPSKKVFLEKRTQKDLEETDVFKQIVKRIQNKTNLKEQQIIDKIKKISKEKNIDEKIAALLEAKDHDIELSDFLKELENKII